jgi:hypothetical protein
VKNDLITQCLRISIKPPFPKCKFQTAFYEYRMTYPKVHGREIVLRNYKSISHETT